jgi:hypothetical protein
VKNQYVTQVEVQFTDNFDYTEQEVGILQPMITFNSTSVEDIYTPDSNVQLLPSIYSLESVVKRFSMLPEVPALRISRTESDTWIVEVL